MALKKMYGEGESRGKVANQDLVKLACVCIVGFNFKRICIIKQLMFVMMTSEIAFCQNFTSAEKSHLPCTLARTSVH